MHMAPNGIPFSDDADGTGIQRVRYHSRQLDRVAVEWPRALAEDSRCHDDVCGYAEGRAGLAHGEVRRALVVCFARFAVLFVGVDVFGVGEDVRVRVVVGVWSVA